jgi:Cys-tRNA(Pro)/Cys-tRNA(Cys) deacylase
VTPAVEAARQAGIPFTLHEYAVTAQGPRDHADGIARKLGIEPARLFKTLVASVDDDLRIFVVPSDRALDLRAVGKRAKLAEPLRAERATGYVVGGISPLGQRRLLPTVVDESALGFETILVSAGRRGLQIELDPRELIRLLGADVRPIATAES